jgi:hypothetical protein
MADRLDLRRDGTAWIIDYKTGGTPSRKEARILLDPQLALEAYALINGGFTDVGRMPVSGLFYLRLTGREPFAERIDTDPEKPGRDEFLSPADLAAKAVDEFVKLVACSDPAAEASCRAPSRAAPAISAANTTIWRGLPNGRPLWTPMEVMAMTDDSGMTVISDTTLRQNLAATPTLSAWVSANAGSGKTHVLARRVIRLLLRGARPSAILCLTYTKAASAEMSNRIFRTLGEWVRLDDAGLAERIAELEGREAEPHQLVRARRLFATALETPGGLKIQTIHAFCEAVLHRFPLEANIPGHFSVLDDQKAAELAGRGAPPADVGPVIRERSGSGGCRHGGARHRRRGGFDKLLAGLYARRRDYLAFDAKARTPQGAEALIRNALGLVAA